MSKHLYLYVIVLSLYFFVINSNTSGQRNMCDVGGLHKVWLSKIDRQTDDYEGLPLCQPVSAGDLKMIWNNTNKQFVQYTIHNVPTHHGYPESP